MTTPEEIADKLSEAQRRALARGGAGRSADAIHPSRHRVESMQPYRAVAELHNVAGEPFAVVAINPAKRSGDGVEAIVQSLHWSREEAEAAAKEVQ